MPQPTIVVRVDGRITRVKIAGVIDETADLSRLDGLKGAVELDVAEVRRFNSMGVRLWTDAIRGLGKRARMTFVGCSRAVVQQLNMISNFLDNGQVASFAAPMRCEACDLEVDHLVTVDAYRARGGLPPCPCPRCHRDMELDEFDQVYLAFLRDRPG
jgi:hypothetical protein